MGTAGLGTARKLGALASAVALAALVCAPAATLARETTTRNSTNISATPQSPLLLLVSLRKQRIRVFDVNGEIASSRVSSGMPGFDTPTGVFSILEKNQHHVSNIYAGAPMPFMQRLTWSGIALHAGVVPGYRASHGCIRLPYSFARSLFGTTKIQQRVIVTGEETSPIVFDHPKLFKPLPLDTAPAGKEQQVAINDLGEGGDATRFFGVTPALARAVAELPPSDQRRPSTRAEADRMFSDRISRLQSQMRSAERARVAATEKAKVAVKEAGDARAELDTARRIIEPLRAAVIQAQRAQEAARQAYVAYIQSPAGWSEDKEFALEDAVINATAEVDAARAEVARNELEFAAKQAASSAAEATRTAALDFVRKNQIDLRTVQTALISANKESVRRLKPVSVFISLRSRQISIRQGVDPVLEAPISLAGGQLVSRVGTHVFTAMRFSQEDPDAFEWHLVSAHTPATNDPDQPRKRRDRIEASAHQSTEANARMAARALDAIVIPSNIMSTIAELARPGSSLIISDRDLPQNENGLGTEFVVLTR